MNIKNLEFLKDSIKYLGFGEKMNAELENQIKQQPLAFQLTMTGEFNKDTLKDKVDYVLDFRKSDQTDMYFFNRYQATLRNEDPEKQKTQTFYITKNSGITAKEAYNLLSGRAVNKDLLNAEQKPYTAWVQLDFSEKDKHDNHKVKQFHKEYGYEVESVLARYPIKELGNEEQRGKLIKSLNKGNIQPVTFIREGVEEKMFVNANPQYKTLDLYDAQMKKQFQGVEKKEKQEEPGKSHEKKEQAKQEVDEPGEKSEKKTKRRGVGV